MKKILLLLLLTPWFVQAQLNGIYTIGGTTPNYTTITAAVNDLISLGVNGPVTFNIRNGIYTEKVILPAITGASSVNTITFQSESLDSAAVRWQNNSTLIADNYVLQLDGADYIRVKHLSLFRYTSGANGCRIVIFQNGASNNRIENSHIRGKSLTSSTNHELIYSTNTLDTANVINYNKFTAGYYSIYLQGSSSTVTENSNWITNNNFASGLYGVYATNVSNIRINGNSFSVVTQPVNIVNGKLNGRIINNNCSGQGGIQVSNFASTSGDSLIIYGNMTRATGGAGIYVSQCPITYIVHNSIRASTGSSQGALQTNISTVHAYNNIIQNYGTGYAMHMASTSMDSDYNIFYTGTTLLMRYGSTNYNTLAAWKTALLQDDYSFVTLPGYTSASNLHILSDIQASDNALNLSVGNDLDGDTRSTTPDIGADEFNQPDNDAGIIAITNIPSRICSGTTPVNVNLRNFGDQLLTSAIIKWKVNGVNQPDFSWSGSLSPGDTATNVTIGNYTILQDQTYTFKVWAGTPNGVTDPVAINDTTTTGLIKTRMSGNYTIGGTTPNYSTINLSITDLNDRGVCGPVTFNIRPGNYNEALSFIQINGASYSNYITYQSESLDSSSVKIQQSESSFSPNWIIQAGGGTGTSHLRFRHLTIRRTTDPFGSTNHLVAFGQSNDIRFDHVYFRGADRFYGDAVSVDYTSNFHLTNCKIYRMEKGIDIYNASTPKDSNYVIMNNSFEHIAGGYIQCYLSNDSLIIKDNVLFNDTINVPDGYCLAAGGILLGTINGKIEIMRNKISGRFDTGMDLTALNGTASQHAKVNNNFICVGSLNSNGAYGVDWQWNTYLDFEHNSIRMYNTPYSLWGTISEAAVYFTTLGGGTNNRFVNNCIEVDSTQYVYEFPGTWTPIFSAFDYNNIYITDPGYTQMTNAITGWPGAFNANTININPLYETRYDLHINNPGLAAGTTTPVTTDIDGDVRSVPPTIGADEGLFFTNDAGSLFPNLTHACDSTHIYARIFNYGINTITSVNLSAEVNAVSVGPVTWTGTLAPGDTTASIYIGKVAHDFGTNYSGYVYTSDPNASTDPYVFNDSTSIAFYLPSQQIDLGSDQIICSGDSVELIPSVVSYFNSFLWSNGDTTSSVYASNGGAWFVQAENEYGCLTSDTIIVTEGGLLIPDIAANVDSIYTNISGNNQWYFNGTILTGSTADFHIALNNGDYYLIHTDSLGCVTYSDTVTITGLGFSNGFNSQFTMYPNPANTVLNVASGEQNGFTIFIHDSSGKLILMQSVSENRITIPTLNVGNGLYLITIKTETTTVMNRFIVIH